MTDATGPAVRLQVLVQTAGARRRAMLAVRVGGDGIAWEAATLRATLAAAVAKIERKLDREGIAHHRISGAALTDLMPAAGSVREARDHLTIGSTSQITLRVALPAAGMTSDMVVRLTESPDAVDVADVVRSRCHHPRRRRQRDHAPARRRAHRGDRHRHCGSTANTSTGSARRCRSRECPPSAGRAAPADPATTTGTIPRPTSEPLRRPSSRTS